MSRNQQDSSRTWRRSALLLAVVLGIGVGFAGWKYLAVKEASAAMANQPEPVESISVAVAQEREHRETATSIGTVLALQSVSLRNEVPGTVREVRFRPGQIVEPGAVLVALDVSVEEAELRAQEAQAVLAETVLQRVQRLMQDRAAPQVEVDRALAQRDVALAAIARTRAVIARKTIRAPFRARAGITDLHPGQYLSEGTLLTTLQSVEAAAHVDFAVAQSVAASLRAGEQVEILTDDTAQAVAGRVVAIDSRVDPATRNATIRARTLGADGIPPGASVRVRVPVGPARRVVAVPVSALRKGPAGDHVFVVEPAEDQRPRARFRPVRSGPVVGDEVVILEGLAAGEQVAATGSFKLRDAVLVAVAPDSAGLSR